jgi:hypothetical protein
MDITLVCLAITSGPPLLERHDGAYECCRIYLGGIKDRVLSALEVVDYGSLHFGQVSFLEEEGRVAAQRCGELFSSHKVQWMWVLRQVVVSMPGIGNPLPAGVNMLIDDFSGMETRERSVKVAELMAVAPVLCALEMKGLHWNQISLSLNACAFRICRLDQYR